MFMIAVGLRGCRDPCRSEGAVHGRKALGFHCYYRRFSFQASGDCTSTRVMGSWNYSGWR